jgi:plasmid stabilization system protein ParE
MNTEQGFTLHPGAAQDITDIWEFILEDNPLAARRVREDIPGRRSQAGTVSAPRTQET